MNELALFAGAGGGILGGHLLGWRTVCAVEWESYPASVLCARQNDGLLPPFPIWDDVQTFDGKPWRGIVDVISGGFPCQDISAAGKGVGIDGERSGMWGEMARIIHEVQPRFVFVENSPMLTSRGLGRVLGDLASMGFDARWGVLGAADIGANHQRDRIWIVSRWKGNLPHAQHDRIRWWEQQQKSVKETHGEIANTNCNGLQIPTNKCELESQGINQLQIEQSRNTSHVANSRCQLWDEGNSGDVDTQEEIGTSSPIFNQSSGQGCGKDQVADTREIRPCGEKTEQGLARELRFAECGVDRNWWQREPESIPRTTQRNMGGMVDGLASRVDRLKAIGNGQVPLCAATAWRILSEQK
jgi:DNA (cytosine-5)-methyltransferase 1